ncbi:DUF3140 domain-containing protein [soil metagenome]
MADDKLATRKEFEQLVNMAPQELGDWLETDASKSVGQDSWDGEAIGHKSGERIIEIKHKHVADYSDDDYDHMGRVISYIKRHSAQGPDDDVKESRWRYSLMNWGHDPCKEDGADC